MEEQAIIDLICEVEIQPTEAGKREARIRLLKHYYFLPEPVKETVKELIEPYLRTDIPFEKDPLILEAEALLNRLEARSVAAHS